MTSNDAPAVDGAVDARPVASAPPSGPFVGGGRSVAEVRADLARDIGDAEYDLATDRLVADVPWLLAEVEAAHRFEQQAGVEREALLAEVERLRALVGSEAWFGAWECGCTDTERSAPGIPEFCPVHGRKLISNSAGATKVQLTHSGVSGYGFRAGPR